MEARNLPDAEFKTMIIRMLKVLMGRMNELSENFNKKVINIKKDIETIKNKQSGKKNIVSEMKNTLEGINNRLEEAEDLINYLAINIYLSIINNHFKCKWLKCSNQKT